MWLKLTQNWMCHTQAVLHLHTDLVTWIASTGIIETIGPILLRNYGIVFSQAIFDYENFDTSLLETMVVSLYSSWVSIDRNLPVIRNEALLPYYSCFLQTNGNIQFDFSRFKRIKQSHWNYTQQVIQYKFYLIMFCANCHKNVGIIYTTKGRRSVCLFVGGLTGFVCPAKRFVVLWPTELIFGK